MKWGEIIDMKKIMAIMLACVFCLAGCSSLEPIDDVPYIYVPSATNIYSDGSAPSSLDSPLVDTADFDTGSSLTVQPEPQVASEVEKDLSYYMEQEPIDIYKFLDLIGQEQDEFRAGFVEDVKQKYFSEMDDTEIVDYIRHNGHTMTAGWSIGYFVDDFGNPTEEPYARKIVHGTFSNSATTGDDLLVEFIVSARNFEFELLEYGNHPVTDDLTIDVKDDDNGNVFTVENKNYSGRISISYVYKANEFYEPVEYYFDNMFGPQTGYMEFMNRISDGGNFKFSARDSYYSKYNFQCDTDGLPVLVAAMMMKAGYVEDLGWMEAFEFAFSQPEATV